MSDYGADKDPSIPAAQDLAYIMGFLPLEVTNVMQWTYPDDVVVRKLAHRKTGSNVLFKFALPPPPPVIPPDLPPVPAGDACTICWGDGKPFGVGETPESITVVVQDIKKGPAWMPIHGEPPNGTYELMQDGANSCRFVFEDDDFLIIFFSFAATGAFAVQNKPTMVFSFLTIGIACQTFYENSVVTEFVNGTTTIFIPPIS